MAADMKLVRCHALSATAGELATAGSKAVRIELLPFRSAVNLRGPATEAFAKAVEAAFGAALPLEPNRWSGGRDRAALWLGPDEWLLVAPDGEAQAIQDAIRGALSADPWLSLVDVSHNYTSLRVSGSAMRALLAKGIELDLHPSVLVAGDCVQTLMAKARVLLRALDDGSAIELWVRNSYARYSAEWLLDAAAEFRQASAAEP